MTPLEFELTAEEAAVAASRAAWRFSLRHGLLAQHLAPLAAFFLALLFATILGLTGLVSRRAAEIALILAAAAYMAYRLTTRRRFMVARRAANAWGDTLRQPLRLHAEAEGLRLQSAAAERAVEFADGYEVEQAGELVYVWPRKGEPLVWPSRVEGASDFLALARARLRPGG